MHPFLPVLPLVQSHLSHLLCHSHSHLSIPELPEGQRVRELPDFRLCLGCLDILGHLFDQVIRLSLVHLKCPYPLAFLSIHPHLFPRGRLAHLVHQHIHHYLANPVVQSDLPHPSRRDTLLVLVTQAYLTVPVVLAVQVDHVGHSRVVLRAQVTLAAQVVQEDLVVQKLNVFVQVLLYTLVVQVDPAALLGREVLVDQAFQVV